MTIGISYIHKQIEYVIYLSIPLKSSSKSYFASCCSRDIFALLPVQNSVLFVLSNLSTYPMLIMFIVYSLLILLKWQQKTTSFLTCMMTVSKYQLIGFNLFICDFVVFVKVYLCTIFHRN